MSAALWCLGLLASYVGVVWLTYGYAYAKGWLKRDQQFREYIEAHGGYP